MELSKDLISLKQELNITSDPIEYRENLYLSLNYSISKNLRTSLLNILNAFGYWGKTQYHIIGKKMNKILYSPITNIDVEINLERDFIELRFDDNIFDIKYSDFETKREAEARLIGDNTAYFIANKDDYIALINFKKVIEEYLKSAGYDFLLPIDVISIAKKPTKTDIVAFSENYGFSYLLLMLGKKGLFGK